MATSPPPFRLFDLPRELRDLIFTFAVRAETPEQSISPRVSIPRDAFVLRVPALTHVCRQARRESLPLYFESNTFAFDVRDVTEAPLQQDLRYEKKLLTFGAWCEAVGLQAFGAIRRFRFSWPAVWVHLRGRGVVEVWCQRLCDGPNGCYLQRVPAPEKMADMVRRAVEGNGGFLLPTDVVELCGEIKRSDSRGYVR